VIGLVTQNWILTYYQDLERTIKGIASVYPEVSGLAAWSEN